MLCWRLTYAQNPPGPQPRLSSSHHWPLANPFASRPFESLPGRLPERVSTLDRRAVRVNSRPATTSAPSDVFLREISCDELDNRRPCRRGRTEAADRA